MMLTRALTTLLSPSGKGAALSILIFHRVLEKPDPLFPEEPDARRFDTLLKWISAQFQVLPLDRAISALTAGTLPPRALSITFDDGYADNFTVALPLLLQHRLNATFFVASSFLDGGRMWNDILIESVRNVTQGVLDLSTSGLGSHAIDGAASRRRTIDTLLSAIKYVDFNERSRKVAEIAAACGTQLPDDLMMTSTQLRALRASGMLIGGHTRTHPILARLSPEDAFKEIADGKFELEEILSERVTLFAYPNGKPQRDYGTEHVSMVRKAGYEAAVSTSPGAARAGTDIYQLPRFTPWDRTHLRFGLRMVSNLRLTGEIA